MAEHNDLGKWGEEYAMNYLRDHGYIILEHDWRYGKSKSDIDIICKTEDQTMVVFVEVKTRSHHEITNPEDAVNRRKIYHLGRAADNYVKLNHVTELLRFDIITVVGCEGGKVEINHMIDAFNPLLL